MLIPKRAHLWCPPPALPWPPCPGGRTRVSRRPRTLQRVSLTEPGGNTPRGKETVEDSDQRPRLSPEETAGALGSRACLQQREPRRGAFWVPGGVEVKSCSASSSTAAGDSGTGPESPPLWDSPQSVHTGRARLPSARVGAREKAEGRPPPPWLTAGPMHQPCPARASLCPLSGLRGHLRREAFPELLREVQ